jgi:isopentenyl-diphosphate delta-isomerase
MHAMNGTQEQVVLVNELDEELGTMGKLQAHEQGALHRAFSVFLFDQEGRLLLQKRAAGKYHSAGLWTNTCCSHPRPGEDLLIAAGRRLREEMGIETRLEHRFSFIYHGTFDNGLQEHELDHVFFGRWSGPVQPDPTEVGAWEYVETSRLSEELRRHPDRYTIWLRACWDQVCEHLHPASVRP